MNDLIQNALNQAREREADRQEQLLRDEQEAKRLRPLYEAQKKIHWWIDWHSRKTKTVVKISIVSQYVPAIERRTYNLRLFVGGKLNEIIPIDENAATVLTVGITEEILSGTSFFELYTNQKL